MTRLKNQFKIYAGSTPDSKNEEYWNGNVVWVTPADFKTDDKYVSKGAKTLTEAGYASCNTTLVPAGSLVVSKRAPVGTVAIAGTKLCTNQGCLTCVPKAGVNSEFYYYVLSCMQRNMESLAQGTTFLEISAQSFANMSVPAPSTQKQADIAIYLREHCSSIDSAISKHQQIIEKLEEYRRAVITQAVTKGLNPNVEMKDSDDETIHEIPSHWLWTRVKFSVTVVRGGSPRPIEQYVIGEKEDGYNWIKIGDATGGGKYILSTKQRIKPEGLSKTRLVHSGTLLLTNSMSFGHPYFLQIDGCIHDGWLAFSDYKGINPMFLYYYLMAETTAHQFTTTADGSVVQNLNIDKVKNSHIALPPMNEQAEIAAYLDERCEMIDTLIEKHNQLISKLQEYKQSLIYNAVTGKIDCTAEA
ncbi:restriction endonuclease subunit S [Anaerolactibacter massiliensis]|uniref:restriction endonuclease subunit S n=1 Tax=Anaerolactibacter massiliensis TaxID=2044573 RepID=UPI000CF9B418|nr:restriction endonuclease subunit S [Anaerolactibacter massiliensis]